MISFDPLASWVHAFATTEGVEVMLAAALAPRGCRAAALRAAILLNAFTHPLAWLACTEYGAPWALVEAAVLAVEAVGYAWAAGLSPRRAVGVALACNALTAGIALVA